MRAAVVLALLILLGGPAFAGDEVPVAVSGRVLDEAGRPMEGVRVYAGVYEAGNSAVTDADGRFALRLRHAKTIPLTASANGHLAIEKQVPRGTHGLELTLRVGARLRGRLAVPEGIAMPSEVKIVSRLAHGHVQRATVAGDGRFEIGGFEPGRSERLAIWAAKLDPRLFRDRRFRTDRPLDLGPVALGRARPVEVHVRYPDGAPSRDAVVRVESRQWSALQWRANTDSAGVARVEAAATAPLRIWVRGPHTDSARWTRTLPAGPTSGAPLTVTIEHPVTLQGTLAWAGAGPAPWAAEHGIQVTLAVLDDPARPRYWHGRTAGNGSAQIQIHGCVPGDWKKAEIRVAVGKRWSTVRRALTIPRVQEPRGRVDLGTIEIPQP